MLSLSKRLSPCTFLHQQVQPTFSDQSLTIPPTHTCTRTHAHTQIGNELLTSIQRTEESLLKLLELKMTPAQIDFSFFWETFQLPWYDFSLYLSNDEARSSILLPCYLAKATRMLWIPGNPVECAHRHAPVSSQVGVNEDTWNQWVYEWQFGTFGGPVWLERWPLQLAAFWGQSECSFLFSQWPLTQIGLALSNTTLYG